MQDKNAFALAGGEEGGFHLFFEIKTAHSIDSLPNNALVMSLLIHVFMV